MATSRKSSGRRPAAKSAPKPSARRGAARPATHPKAAPDVARATVAHARPAAKPASKSAATRGKKSGGRPLSRTALMAKEAAERRRLAEKKKAELAAVRPLGVLPPESRARVVERALPAAARPRPQLARGVSAPAQNQGVEGVTEQDLKELEVRLLDERRKIMKDMGHLENTVLKVNQRDSSGDLSGYSFHMADAGTDAMEREKAFLFASTEGRLLMEVNDALRRLYNGVYGICEVCEKPISRARLQAMPYTRMCVSCKVKEEKAGRSTPGQ
jgi:RNA polymerase-binding transcription factor DksA